MAYDSHLSYDHLQIYHPVRRPARLESKRRSQNESKRGRS